ncbi:MAG: HEAT repeat domain-containing protein, partial [bacterium]|nr:HEAT repeat domain-containing protein [bacterium]
MSRTSSQEPQLLQFYKQYLLDENSAVFIRSVALAYTVPTLERMVLNGVRLVRRAAALSLAYLGEYDSCPTLSAALVDDDRGVRILADHGVRELWRRDG